MRNKGNMSKMMVKFFKPEYIVNLNNWDLENIKYVEQIYAQILSNIQLQK